MRSILRVTISLCFLFLFVFQAESQSIHQQQLEYYNSLGNAEASHYENLPVNKLPSQPKVNCELNKMVYGWHPYWIGSAFNNYQWDLLSHLSFFSYDVDYSTGNATSTHGWATSSAVNSALANNVKVTLTVTLFSNHATFLGNATSKQTLITNLISLINSRGAHGVNIDFEGLPSSQSTNFANFMVDLANQMHAAIPNSEVSTVLYSVDWSSVFNFQIMEPEVDYYIIMGYDYYYGGSSTAGPNDPLYQFGSSYNYTLSRSITDYLDAGCSKNKLILGLPYYGREWSTTSLTVPSGTTATGVSRTYSYVNNNSTGYYSAANHTYEVASESDMYLFMNGSTPKQCFITEEGAFSERLQHVLNTGIGGIGIWALGYDDGYTEFWNAIEDKLTDCHEDPCSGTIHDFGGALKNYYNNEDYIWTIEPPNATSLDINFSTFDIELDYDFLYIHDGSSTAATQIPGSPFTGTNSPGSFSTSTGAVTFRFTSDLSTVKPGFLATYTCNQDDVPPTTLISTIGNWQTSDFNVTFNDADNSAIEQRYSLYTDHDGSDRSANRDLGYLYEDFNTTLTGQWSTGLGTWTLSNGALLQTSESETNSACDATLTQNSSTSYVYNWNGKIGGTGSNRRAGLHFFCSDPSLPNRGNSYLVYWRVDTDKCQIYRATNDNLVLQTNDDIVVDPNVIYDFKIIYDPATGIVSAYLDDQLVSTWTDPSPLTTGSSVSFRSGNCTMTADDVKVFKSRSISETATIGNSSAMLRYENSDPISPNAQIFSLVMDDAGNFSTISSEVVNIDWTIPDNTTVNDGLGSDIATFITPNEISANWASSSDPNSGLNNYYVSVGTSPGSTDIVGFTDVGLQTNYTFTGLNLTVGQTYYLTVRALNGAGLQSIGNSSDGQILQSPTSSPIANFHANESVICAGDSVELINTSTDGISFLWSCTGGMINSPNAQQPYFIPDGNGTYEITLIATNSIGSNQLSQFLNITVLDGPIASATPDQTDLSLPNAIVLFNNTSLNSDSYVWYFGDGDQSTDQHPWHSYSASGQYLVMLVAIREGCLNDTTYFNINVGNAGVEINENSEFSVFPNPFTQTITINGTHLEGIKLYDVQGKLIYEKSLKGTKSSKLILNSEIEQGIYFLHVQNNGQLFIERLLKL